MSEPCPSCGGELSFVDVNFEMAMSGAPKSGRYEYRHLPADGRCSLAVQPGISHIRCWGCSCWVKGKRDKLGAVICLDCIQRGYDYDAFDFRSGLDGPERIQ